MQSRRHTAEDEHHGIDLAPMLDFTINLLIFFIITTSFIKETGVVVTKPSATTAEFRQSGNLLIGVRANGEIWMDRQRVEPRDLRTLVERYHIERPDDTVVIIADRASSAGAIAEIMDEVRSAGITSISIAADPGSSGG
jgi:biopolymer transport protein ExbD